MSPPLPAPQDGGPVATIAGGLQEVVGSAVLVAIGVLAVAANVAITLTALGWTLL